MNIILYYPIIIIKPQTKKKREKTNF